MAAPMSDEKITKVALKGSFIHTDVLDSLCNRIQAVGSSSGIYLIETVGSPSGTNPPDINIIANDFSPHTIIPKFGYAHADYTIPLEEEDDMMSAIESHALVKTMEYEPPAGVKRVRWAPLNHQHRSILGVLTEDHALCLIRQSTQHLFNWSLLCDISKTYLEMEEAADWPHSRSTYRSKYNAKSDNKSDAKSDDKSQIPSKQTSRSLSNNTVIHSNAEIPKNINPQTNVELDTSEQSADGTESFMNLNSATNIDPNVTSNGTEPTTLTSEPIKKLTKFQHSSEVTRTVSAIDLNWSPAFRCDDPFSLLAVAMANHDIVIWKVPLLYQDSMTLSHVSTQTCCTAGVTSLSWSPNVTHIQGTQQTYIAVGEANGHISLLPVSCDSTGHVTVGPRLMVWSDGDCIQPSCLAWMCVDDTTILLTTKSSIILAFGICQQSGNVVHQTQTRSDLTIPCSGISVSKKTPTAVLCSPDGSLHHLSVSIHPNGVNLRLEEIPLTIDTLSEWGCLGVSLSHNSLYISLVASRCSPYNIRMTNVSVYATIPNPHADPKAAINSYIKQATNEANTDIYDYVRLCVQSQTNLPGLTDYQTIPANTWYTLPLNHLRLISWDNCGGCVRHNRKNISNIRHGLLVQCWNVMLAEKDMTVSNQRGDTTPSEDKTEKQNDKQIRHITNLITLLGVITTLKAYKNLPSDALGRLSPIERKSIALMCIWWESKKGKFDWSMEAYNDVTSILIRRLQLPRTDIKVCHLCVICGRSQQYSDDDFTISDSAGHTFGVCRMSLLPCDSTELRHCVACVTPYISHQTLSDFSESVQQNAYNCLLCGADVG